MSLDDQPVLLLDIQATAAAAAGGVLLEVGWWPYPPGGPHGGIQTRLAKHASIPMSPRLTRLTGLSSDELRTGSAMADIWKQLQHAAGQVVAARDDMAPACPVVVHYVRFEAPYLAQFQALAGAAGDVALDLICTHEITRRLLPGLPRKGLRAVAGYFGHDTPSKRRCVPHLRATAAIWAGLATVLAARYDITTLGTLKTWLEKAPIPSKAKRIFQVPETRLADLPHGPGVYRLLSYNGKCLYAGKAKDLHRRVCTYFQPRRHHAEHILEMLSRAADLKISSTRTALEAALLEHDLIKQLAPPYNIALRSDAAELQFWSQDFQHWSPCPDLHRPRGPLPAGEATPILKFLVQSLPNIPDHPALVDLRNTLAETAHEDLDIAMTRAGLQLFRKTHCALLDRQPPPDALLDLGRRLWIDRQLAATSEAQGEGDNTLPVPEEGSDIATAPYWSPDRICRRLEQAIRHTGALLRRSRWLALLGNATLVWAPPYKNTQHRRYLVFREGIVVARGDHDPQMATTPGRQSPPRQRWRPADRATYDRLRVATTELRRLVQEKRSLTIRLGPTQTELHSEQVARLLGWF